MKIMPKELIYVSAHFRTTVESTILQLERGAAHDEQLLLSLSNSDHQRRQRLLVQRQLDRAFRLRKLLSLMSKRSQRVA
jgi:hypothetical protein